MSILDILTTVILALTFSWAGPAVIVKRLVLRSRLVTAGVTAFGSWAVAAVLHHYIGWWATPLVVLLMGGITVLYVLTLPTDGRRIGADNVSK